MRKLIVIGLIGASLTGAATSAQAGDEAAAFLFGTLVGGALAEDGNHARIYISHYPDYVVASHGKKRRAYRQGYRDARRDLLRDAPPRKWRRGLRPGYRHAHEYRRVVPTRRAYPHGYRAGYRDARRDVKRIERHRDERGESRAERVRAGGDSGAGRRGGRHDRNEVRRAH